MILYEEFQIARAKTIAQPRATLQNDSLFQRQQSMPTLQDEIERLPDEYSSADVYPRESLAKQLHMHRMYRLPRASLQLDSGTDSIGGLTLELDDGTIARESFASDLYLPPMPEDAREVDDKTAVNADEKSLKDQRAPKRRRVFWQNTAKIAMTDKELREMTSDTSSIVRRAVTEFPKKLGPAVDNVLLHLQKPSLEGDIDVMTEIHKYLIM